jgi:hypothetical protein
MHSYSIPFLLAALIMASAGDVEAQRTGNREMNERINALRNRLQNYQLERVREEPKKVSLVDEKETVEVKFEELIENFETRKDVAVTVLFHDEDFAGSRATEISAAAGTDEKLAQTAPDNEPVTLSTASDKTSVIVTAARQLELERAQRQEKYDALRRRVHMATRRVHDQATDINRLVAKVP